MKKRIFLSVILVISLFIITGCGNTNNNINDNSENNIVNQKASHKIYKYMKISSTVASSLYYNTNRLFGDLSTVAHGENEYNPLLIVEFDTNTGNATSAKLYSFFLDYSDDKWVNEAINKYNEASNELKKEVTNVSKGRVDDNVSYLTANIDPNSYAFEQYLQMLFKGQDIEKYKNDVYYDNLYNYSTAPKVEVGENYFETVLTDIRIEWSDNEIKPFIEDSNSSISNNSNSISNSSISNNSNSNNNNNSRNSANNQNNLLVGIWQTEISECIIEINGEECGTLNRNFYIFNSDGTWDYVQIYSQKYSDGDIHDQLDRYLATNAPNKNNTFEYNGTKISFNMGEKITELTINNNSFRIENDYGRSLKENGNSQVGTFEKYR